jgi:hypothetical protein
MIRIVLASAAFLSVATAAQAKNLIGDSVVLRTLDKVTAKTQDVTVQVGDVLEYGSLSIDVKHCEKRPPEDIPETFVFVQIDDRRLDGDGEESEAERVYSGWMLGSNPAKAALDHPVYDVWVIDCNTPAPLGQR